MELEEDRVRPPGSEVVRLVSNNEKALSLMDWKPKVNLETGLAATIEHIRQNPNSYRSSGYVV